ncbi:MAG: hypothetical protein H0W02_00880 [Ktedonobacteraceae bacterium]|nr:hypothetical protein [Ktedonobacteraceae bacterium]
MEKTEKVHGENREGTKPETCAMSSGAACPAPTRARMLATSTLALSVYMREDTSEL